MQRKKNDVKARTTLLLSLPDEHQMRFSKYKTTKELWAVILKTFGGNEATKKRKKNLLKQQYGNFKVEGSKKPLTDCKNDLETMSLDDLYNHLKVYKAKVQTKSNSNSQNMAFISSSKNSSGNEDGNIACVSISSTIFPTTSASVATISQDTTSAYIASHMRANKFWTRTGKKISIQGSNVAGFDKSKVECFNCHKMGHFVRECRAPKSQERGRKESYRQGSKAEEKTPKALMAIDEVGWDWSYTENEGEDHDHVLVADVEALTEFALMANTESKVFDNSLCSNDSVAQLKGRLVEYKEREVKYIKKIRTLEMYKASNLKCIKTLDKELEELKLEKDGLDGKLAGLLKASKNLDNLIESQRSNKVKDRVGYNVVPLPTADLYLSPKKDLSWTGLPEFVDDTVTDYSRPSPTIESTSAEGQNKDSSTSEDVVSPNIPKPFVKFVKPKDSQSESLEFVLNKKACYNYGDFSHLANDCRKRVQRETSRPHGPSMNPIRPNMNGARPNRSFFIQAPSYETRPSLESSAVKTQYRALWVSAVNRNNPPVNRKFSTGLPTKSFDNDHTCTACLKGNQHKASCKSKTKDETSDILKWFITKIENLKDIKVKIIRCDNGGEFRNKEMNDFCLQKGIKRAFSNARTLQQNGFAERRNRTLIEAARTMLADVKLPVTFWAEAVNTACYVQNRVLVNKSQNKTPYELFNGRTPAIGFLKPFGCHVMIFNTLYNLGKFEPKGDEGYFIRYSMSSKAFKVFNKRSKRVEENLHVEFLENKAIEKGAGPNWLFDIDSLTKSMNYVPVDAGTNSTNFSGTKDAANQEVKKDVSSLRYIALPNWAHDALLESSSSKPHDESSTKVPEGSRNPNSTASSSNPPADQMETLIVESPIPTVSSPVPTTCLNDFPELFSEARLISKRVANQEESPSLDNILSLTNRFEDILGVTTSSDEAIGVEADVSNMETTISVSPTPTLRIHKDHPKSQIISLVDTPIQTRHKSKEVEEQKPKKVSDALQDLSWVEAMQEELLQFKIQKVWILVDCPKGVRPIGTKWILKNKKDKRGIVVRNKAPRARYGTLSKYLLKNGFQRGTIDQTLFIRRQREDFILVQVYVGEIIFGSLNLQLCREFEALMHKKFQMSAMGKLNFFLRLQVLQKEDVIFLSQYKYIGDILKKFRYLDVRSLNTPMDKENPWGKDRTGKDVDLHLYRSMIGYLMYLTASRPDIMFAVCACARHQVTPKECHLHAVKRIFRYLKGHLKLGLWYPKASPFDLVGFSDSDYGGASQDRKSTTGGINTACYVQNRVLVNKSQNKTPYELFNGRTLAIGFLKPFACHVMILNTLDNLGKFEPKGYESYFIRYSMSSKAFRVFNKRSKRVEENLHVEFLENKAIEKGTKDAANQEVKKDISSLRYIALPNWAHDALLESSSIKPHDESSTKVPKGKLFSEARLISKRVANQEESPSLDNILSMTNRFEDILRVTTSSDEAIRVEADVSNMETTISVSPTPTLRIHKDHPKSQIIGLMDTPIQTRHKSKEKVWILVDCPKGVRPIGTKWVLKNKKDERGIVVRNKARLVAQGHTQEEGIDYDEVFLPVARIEAIRLFLAYASFMGFTMYQMDVKSAFLYGTIDEEGHPKLGLWYPKASLFDLVAFSDSDYGGASQDRKSTTGGSQFLGRRLISWQCKKQTIVAKSTTEAEYVTAASCCGQVLWIQNQLLDYG
nr:uncharacterized mitochondrial protein AtMg00810-like [Tanacetum cinerariifolium]